MVPTWARSYDEKFLYVVMPRMKPGRLTEVTRGRSIPEPEAGHVVHDVLQFVAHLHNVLGKIHRDLKPVNILVGEDGSIRVADFGLCGSAKATRYV